GHALLFLELVDGREQVAISGSALVLLGFRGLVHARTQGLGEIGLAAFEQKLNVAHGFLVGLGRGQALDARSQAAVDVKLEARPRVIPGEIDLAGGNQEVAVNEIDNPVGQISGEVGAVVDAAVFLEAAGDVDAGKTLAESELDVGVSLVVTQQDVEARLLL